MNTQKPFRVSLRVILTVLIVFEYIGISLLSFGFTALLRHFGISFIVPDLMSYLLMGILLGSAVTVVLGAWIFAPITRLGNAMGLVAQGNFNVRLDEKHKFKEIEAIYKNFNLMTRELGNTEILQSDFVSNVSHEFKTPINAIEGYATLLQGERERLTAEQGQYVDKILFNTSRLSKLVGNILLLSKVDNQAIQSQRSTFRLDEQIRQAILHLESEWAPKDIDFDIELDSLEYTGCENLLLHVWTNLIGNAVKFDPPGGFIGIRLRQSRSNVIFTVEDSGPGIPEDAKQHIFDRFYQSDSSHKQEGNGLGLALVKQIVNASRGLVTVENLAEGGCRFTVILPLA